MLRPPSTPLPLRDRLAEAAWRLRRAILIRRRALAFVLVVAAVLLGARAMAAPAPPSVAVTVAARDLPAGATLVAGDVRQVRLPGSAAPGGRIRDPVGRVLAGAVRRGEPITDVRLAGPALTAGRGDLVTTPLRLPDAGLATLLRVGDRIDLMGVDTQAGTAVVLARDCPVLALPSEDAGTGVGLTDATASDGGRIVLLGVPETDVTSVSEASVSHFLTYVYSG